MSSRRLSARRMTGAMNSSAEQGQQQQGEKSYGQGPDVNADEQSGVRSRFHQGTSKCKPCYPFHQEKMVTDYSIDGGQNHLDETGQYIE